MSSKLFVNGFVLTRKPPSWLPAHFVPGPRAVRHLWVDPSAEIDHARDVRGRVVVVIGVCSLLTSGADGSVSKELLRAYRVGEERLLQKLDDLIGRFAVIYGHRDRLRIVNDASAMRSVFYSGASRTVASHAELAERAIQEPSDRDDLPFRYGYPGNRTPFRDIKVLTANTLLDVRTFQTHRFWPRHALPVTTVESVARLLVESSAHALRSVASTRTIRIAMTAGLDSRTLLAVALHCGVAFDLYTYGVDSKTQVDRAVSASLAREHGLRHTILPTSQPSDPLRQRLTVANYANHHWNAVQPLRELFGPQPSVAVTANLLEIGRDFYRRPREQGLPEPTNAVAMAALHRRSMPPAGRRAINEYGASRYTALAEQAFESLRADSAWNAVRTTGISPFDQFYWEHRMSTWHGPAMNERDYYSDAYIPFNYRPLFEAMLGLPLADRQSGACQLVAIASIEPKLLTTPINPKSWPNEDS